MNNTDVIITDCKLEEDIKSINGFTGVDTLNELKDKYKKISLSLEHIISTPPSSIKDIVVARGVKDYLEGLHKKFNCNDINISVIAEVSSGKSTFLNALIFGEKILDAKMGETTAKTFKISYGKNTHLNELKKEISNINSQTKIDMSNENFSIEDINIDDYTVDLKANNDNLKKGIVLYDTPGFGTLNEKIMSKLIKDAVSRSDAVILLLDISKGLKENEAKFIEEALFYIKENKRFIVLNKFDASIDEDEDEDETQRQIDNVIEDTKKELEKISQGIDREILDSQTYYLSALKGLTGKLKNKKDVLEFSRFPIFEKSFWNRIVDAKKEIFTDNVNSLISERNFLFEVAKVQTTNLKKRIQQTKYLVLNIEKISSEIKEIIDYHSGVIDRISKQTLSGTDVVFNSSSIFEKNMNNSIRNTISLAIKGIPDDGIKEGDFVKLQKQIVFRVNEEFKVQYDKFSHGIITDLTEKKKTVNKTVDALNTNISEGKFESLKLSPLSKITNQFSNQDIIKLSGVVNTVLVGEEKQEINSSVPQRSFSEKSSGIDLKNGASDIAAGAAMGAALGSFIPVLGTSIGGAVGAAGGLVKTIFGGNDDAEHQLIRERQASEQLRREMLAKHEREMQALHIENHKRKVSEFKKDFTYDFTKHLEEELSDFIEGVRNNIGAEYKTILSEITATIFNARDTLKDMKTIVEDPSESKKLIESNKKELDEISCFVNDIELCFT